jgi:glycosyltransferase involved in cell wall biosynthesis
LKIAYVINSLEAGGAQYPVPRIVKGLRALDIETTVYALSMRDGRAAKRLDAEGIRWLCAPFNRSAHFQAARWLKAELRRDRPDVIWTSLTQATLLGQRVGKSLNVPVVSWQHNAFLKPINRWLLRRQRGLSDFWIADSQSVLEFAVAEIGLAADDFQILPLFVANPDAPQATPHQSGPFRWVSVGRLHNNKNYAALIDALALYKDRSDWTLDIAGDGAEKALLLQQIADHGLENHITLRGHRDDITQFLASGHGYVQPSRNEGLCISAHEAMTAGLPCVVTATGQMPRTLNGSPGVIPLGEINKVSAQMMAMVDDAVLSERLAVLSRERVMENFAPERFHDSLETIAGKLRGLRCARTK